MTQEDKELLIEDLYSRLLYEVKCKDITLDFVGTMIEISIHDNMCKLFNDYGDNYTCFMTNCKPYLFPLSSMTEEQKKNLTSLFNCHVEITQYEIKFAGYQDSNMDNWNKVFNWCYKHHFDWRGLIPMGLAIDATGLNIY